MELSSAKDSALALAGLGFVRSGLQAQTKTFSPPHGTSTSPDFQPAGSHSREWCLGLLRLIGAVGTHANFLPAHGGPANPASPIHQEGYAWGHCARWAKWILQGGPSALYASVVLLHCLSALSHTSI